MTWIIPKNLHISPFVQDTEALTLDLNESSQICAQSLLVRSKPTRSQTWLQKWKRDSWTQLLFGRILRPSRGKAFEEKWTSSLEASLVNPSQLQDVEEEMKTLDTFFPISKEESLFLDLPLFSSKTSKGSSLQNLEKDGAIEQKRPFCSMFSESWKGWVMRRRREYLARVNVALHIKEKESLSWASLRAAMAKAPSGGGDPSKKAYHCRLENQVLMCYPLTEEMSLENYPEELIQTFSQVEEESLKKNGSLKELLWVTPNVSQEKTATLRENALNKRILDKKQECLQMQIYKEKLKEDLKQESLLWTTPVTQDYKNAKMSKKIPDRKDKKERLDSLPRQVHHGTYQGKLNPRWVETLMGVPIGWTMVTCANPYVIERTNLDSSVTE